MALERRYDERFERLWKAFPKWPPGRSRKELAWKAFKAADKALGFTAEDIQAIENDIEQRKRDCLTWQRGNKFGPVGMQVYFNQHLWNEPYEKVARRPYDVPRESQPEPEPRYASPETVQRELEKLKRLTGGVH